LRSLYNWPGPSSLPLLNVFFTSYPSRNKLQIFLRLEILEADPPAGRHMPEGANPESPRRTFRRKLTEDVVALVGNITANLRGSGFADSALQDFLDKEVKAR
jgi:hypothetical protein